jgi:hypothetical protein
MSSIRRAVFALIVAVAVCVIGMSTAYAARQYEDSVAGYEVYATSTEGVFTGTASGQLPGYWSADVLHTPLSGTPQTATIDGGTFNLYTELHNQATHVTGAFSGGSVVETAGFTGCADQVYAVTGHLINVGVEGRPDRGTGTFAATLTHYRVDLGGYCVIYAASIQGAVTLDF